MSIKLIIFSLVFCLFSSVCCEENQAEVELTHWWNQPGELEALGVIKKAVDKEISMAP